MLPTTGFAVSLEHAELLLCEETSILDVGVICKRQTHGTMKADFPSLKEIKKWVSSICAGDDLHIADDDDDDPASENVSAKYDIFELPPDSPEELALASITPLLGTFLKPISETCKSQSMTYLSALFSGEDWAQKSKSLD